MTQSTNSTKAWFLCLMASLFYAYQSILRLLPNITKDDLMLQFGIDATDFGWYSSAYYAGYTLLHLPMGIALGRFGPRLIIPVSILLCGLGIVPPLLCDQWWVTVAGRFLLGAGSTSAILGVFYMIQAFFPPERFASIFGLIITIGLAGGLAGTPLSVLKETFGWAPVLISLIVFAFVLATLIFAFMPKQSQPTASNTYNSVFDQLKQLLTNKHVWAVAIFSAMMMGPMQGFADAWGVPFFKDISGLDALTAQSLPSMIFFGFMVGAPLLGYVGEKYKKPYTVMVVCALGMGAIFIALLWGHISNPMLLYALMIVVGILCGYQVFMIFINTRVVPKHLVSISSSFTNMVAMFSGTFYHVIIGWLMTRCWDGLKVNGIPVYSPQAYVYGLLIIPLFLVIAGIGLIYIKPKDETKLFQEKSVTFPYTVIDLTHPLDEHVCTWDGECGFRQEILQDYADCNTDVKFRVMAYQMHAGIGTHMDAPSHCIAGGAGIDELDLNQLCMPCVVIDVSSKAHDRYSVTDNDVLSFEAIHGQILTGACVMIRTGWDKYWNTPKYRNELTFPSVSLQAAKLLMERGIHALGIDTLSPDRPQDDYAVHHLFLGSGKVLIENVTNLDQLPPVGSYVIALPMNVRKGTEASIRLVGLIQH